MIQNYFVGRPIVTLYYILIKQFSKVINKEILKFNKSVCSQSPVILFWGRGVGALVMGCPAYFCIENIFMLMRTFCSLLRRNVVEII